MRLTKSVLNLALALSAGTMLGVGAPAQALVALPTANCPDNCLVFEDFTVYSLAFLNFQAGAGSIQPGDPFYVKSDPPEIADAIVVASSGSPVGGGRRNNEDVTAFADDGYDTPNNIPGPFANFLMGETDPDPTFTGDNARQTTQTAFGVPGIVDGTVADLPLWDIQVAALKDFLDGGAGTGDDGELAFFFNLNESNQGQINDGQDMLAFVRVYLTDFGADGVPGGIDDIVISFDLSGNITSPLDNQFRDQDSTAGGLADGPGVATETNDLEGRDDILPAGTDDWVWVHGEICVSPPGGDGPDGLVFLGPCNQAPGPIPGDAVTVNQNLGADTAAFALFSQALSDAVLTGTWDLMTVDGRMARIDNGFEQLFILPVNFDEDQVPEPASLALLGIGLAGLGAFRRLRQQKA